VTTTGDRCWRRIGLGVFLLLGSVGTVRAHEEYVVDEEYDVSVGAFLTEIFTDPLNIGPVIVGGIVTLGIIGAYLTFRPFQTDIAAFRSAMYEYDAYVPWLLRISLGIPLIGAGFGGYFISPAVEVDLRLLQVAIGFGLLFGLATRFFAVVGLLVYLVGAVIWPTILLQLEFVGGLLAIALIGSGRPSADHVLQRMAGNPKTVYARFDPVYERARAFQTWVRSYTHLLPVVIRVGLGTTFIYLGLTQKILRPGIGLAVVDRYNLTAVIPVSPELWVFGAGVAEIALGLAIIAGLFTRASAMVAIGMFSLTLFALPDDPVLAHVALFGMASVLLISGSGPYAADRRLGKRAHSLANFTATDRSPATIETD